MWLNERLAENAPPALPYLGSVIQADNSLVWVDAHQRLTQVTPLVSFPAIGDQVLVFAGMDGFYCLPRAVSGASDTPTDQEVTAVDQ